MTAAAFTAATIGIAWLACRKAAHSARKAIA